MRDTSAKVRMAGLGAALGLSLALGAIAGSAARADDFRAAGVRLHGPRWFEAIGATSGPPLRTTLELEYRLSPAFAAGGSLRVLLGYAAEDKVYVFNGNHGWNGFELADPQAEGFTSVTCSNPAASFTLAGPGGGYPLIGFTIENLQGAAPGDWLRVTIGDRAGGSPGWNVMRHESSARLLVQERDPGAADWRLAWPEEDFPRLTVTGVRADRFVATAPSFAAPGETVDLVVKPVQGEDSFYSANPIVLRYAGVLKLHGSDPAMTMPSEWTMRAGDLGRAVVPVTLPAAPGVYAVRVHEAGNPMAEGTSNPIVVRSGGAGPAPPDAGLYWGSLHNHAIPSGHAMETPQDAYRYARDYADLDFFALTDHCRDWMSFEQFDWPLLRGLGARFSVPGEFVGFSGYEWTNAFDGHRHVIFKDAASVARVPCEAPSTGNDYAPRLTDLEAQLARHESFSIPHHPAWADVRPMQWGAALDDPRRPLAEIYSWHGSSESAASRLPMHNDPAQQHPAGSGAWVQEALAAGHRLGFTGDSDNHRGRPGSNNGATMLDGDPQAPGYYGRMGVTGVYARGLSRDAIWEALAARRTIATTGARIVGGFTVNGHFLGEAFAGDGPPRIRVAIHGTAEIEEVVVFRDGDQVAHVEAPWSRDCAFEFTDPAAAPGEEHSWYVRAIQADGHHLWMSPIWMRWEP